MLQQLRKQINMIVKNQAELNRALKSVAEKALRDAQNEVHVCIEKFVKQYYAEYSPTVYKRTYQFMESITKTGIKSKGFTVTCEIYIDTRMNYEAPTQAVVEMINTGYHAMRKMGAPRDIKGTKVWDESISFIEKYQVFIETFKQSLISQGLTVV